MTPPIKSAFAKMTPRIDAGLRTKLGPSTAVEATPQPSARSTTKQQPQPSNGAGNASANLPAHSMPIELLVSVHDEPDKHGVGYCFFSRGVVAENALSIVLNRNRLVVSKALTKADVVTVTFLYAILLAESCALRRHQSPLVARFQETLARPLYAPHKIARNQILSDFAIRLARSPVLASLKDLPLYGPSPREDTHLVATVTLEVSATEAQAPWKRLSKARKRVSATEHSRVAATT